ncbi:type I-C CRISPR-associated protein Cas8c/Csd1 [Roseococcus sp. SYP-B2431]|uniref:type I-C CRISPR-associated protein Cas8c/Csd1 n=1 Tax=Roseococcus sp. SYP-B2431 TaxID=2496640 RepID=UPI00103F138C|nr:type I-C CRISPR-associated protein Cas8c/Csd1 [Roseococcus sp. SYP-B2431]TCH98146.1 type I-C CRISPR-associated protein Cas8c/Csd1 [Roseococcus sp. SYP-B2431]
MSILQALDGYYGRMAARGEAEAPGYSRSKISFAIVLSAAGEPVDKIDLRRQEGKRFVPRLEGVPAEVIRKSNILPNFLWDKTAYSLGRTLGEGRRTLEEHAAFKAMHQKLLAETNDVGLLALRRFLESWSPERFNADPFVADMLDTNIVFSLKGEKAFIHERPAALHLVASAAGSGAAAAFCLVTGQEAAIQRLHPIIKGVEGAQTAGASLVSFNLDSFESYGKKQGDNAPTSEVAAFRYGAALNRMLDRGSGNRVPRPIGDTTVVFWADASDEVVAKATEDWFNDFFNTSASDGATENLQRDEQQAARIRDALRHVAEGRPVREVSPQLAEGVRFHVLGLAPNAARLSVRFWMADRFEVFAKRLAEHYDDLAIEPPPWRLLPPAVQRLLVKTTAALEKFENIPPQLAGEVTRAVLTGGNYPRPLLAAALMRIRAGDDPSTGWHAAAIRAVLARDARKSGRETPPVSLNREEPNSAYQLGRMFTMAEIAQRMALGKVNATIRDRYFGAASATPASVFPLLLRGMQNHLSKLRKDGKGIFIEREMDQIAEHLPPQLPRSLRLEEQGRFVIGYYHQRRARVGGKAVDDIADEQSPEGNDDHE